MSDIDSELGLRLEDLRTQGLHRQLRRVDSPQQSRVMMGGLERINFSSNDYLGLASHPLLKEAAIRAVEQYGVGSGASRLVCGSLAPHHQLEEAIAAFKQTEAALSFSSGYATATGAVCALVRKGDVVVLDKLIHACLIDAARLSGATVRVFKHNDLSDLEEILIWAKAEQQKTTETAADRVHRPQILIVTESVFSMDGDLAPLRDIVELKERYGAWLMVDEAHGTGLFGEHRRGVIEAMELTGRVEIQMGTLGKAIGAAGGYIAGSRVLIDWLINRARSFIFSTAPAPAAAAAATAALQLLGSDEGEDRMLALWARVNRMKELVIGRGWELSAVQSAILPLRVGAEDQAVRFSRDLYDRGILIPAIRYPTVARGKARLRLTASASHSWEEIDRLDAALATLEPPRAQLKD